MTWDREMNLRLTVRKRDTSIVVHVGGDIDIASIFDLHDFLLLMAEGRSSLTVNLSDVGFMDSTGIFGLMRARAAVRDRGHELVFEEPSERVAHLLDVIGLTLNTV
ncbi:anti-sigma factor antagonist [Herbidospora galbida]|nr:anti-sigma factor antagonist [Herbidospora galbida]